MSTIHSRGALRRIASGAAAIALGLTAAIAATAPASAATGNIDPDAPVSLTLHKYVQPDSGDLGPNDGTEITDPAGTPLAGVEFTIVRITNIDLLTNEGWATLDPDGVANSGDELTAADVLADPATYTQGTEVVGVTDANGVIVWDDAVLDGVGVYLVQETDPGANSIVQPALPFLVTLPLADGAGQWNYDPHVYPKNAVLDQPVKTAEDGTAFELGDSVDWRVSSAVPNLPEGTDYTQYAIGERFDTRLDYTGVTVSLVDGTTTALVEGTDYKVITATGANGEDIVRVDFLQAGLDKLDAASSTATVETVFTTTVTAVGDGNITNVAYVYVNDDTTGNPSNEADTQWADLWIYKYAEDSPAVVENADGTVTVPAGAKLLSGAEFAIYNVDPAANPDAAPIETIVTDADGIAKISLKVGTYWVKETKAPAGYQLDETVREVTLVDGQAVERTDANDTTGQLEIAKANEQVPAYMLPLTGGNGTLLFTLGGIGMVVIAAGALLIINRRRRAVATAMTQETVLS
ncbi:isopeptide-forming domain-containing fimbrial protein [Microbacterium paludicola]|uniref:Isopeptide-forming domain-containing fimbrial protein n=1 Tax=Microbacterium paludicola TaxID=300019 RepID=A0A4Y9FT00_9MICO|nr:SpaH/EbpB family LPXTG-anchored major pilin [Microbacterium paludicola]MBF0816880.1 SpaH/EbpB family LPXTG-anchored major pilin [Microbacterium paludicola]TFU32401.1 isopeptide-forming domain-containing fimbrial protein [Microbacterium paludicola]